MSVDGLQLRLYRSDRGREFLKRSHHARLDARMSCSQKPPFLYTRQRAGGGHALIGIRAQFAYKDPNRGRHTECSAEVPAACSTER